MAIGLPELTPYELQRERSKTIRAVMGPTILRFCLDNQKFDHADILGRVGLRLEDEDIKISFLFLRDGIFGDDGFELERHGAFYTPCVENVARVIANLDGNALEAASRELGCTLAELQERISRMPVTTKNGSLARSLLVKLLSGC